MTGSTRIPGPVPLRFDAAGAWCFGWYQAPAAPWRDVVVVLCPPVGYEAICSYPTYVQLARHLAASGFPVFRFDYQGTGDAAGDDHEPQRVEAWLASIDAAVAQARLLSGAGKVALAGVRLGATLALEAAPRIGDIDSLLLWAPCASGKAFVRELRAVGAEEDDGLLAMGHHYRHDTLADLQRLEPAKAALAPARRALLIGRDDLPVEGPLPGALRSLGVECDYRVLPGYAAMVGEPREGVLSADTLAALTDWLAASPAAALRDDPVDAATPDLGARPAGTVLESTLLFGSHADLCGVLAQPAAGPAHDRRGQTAVLLLNVGGNYRIGPHRVYVTAARSLAAAGYRVLRLDIAGIGDSPPAPGTPWANLYSKASAQDVRQAIDALVLQGCREFVLMGICSGSYVAFQAALLEPRVDGVVLMNSRLLEWTPGKPGDGWQNSMQQYVKSTDWYRRAAFRPEVWRRLLRGEINVRPIAARFLSLAVARLRRALSFGAEREASVLAKMKRLCREGVDVLMLVSDADDGRDYVEFHFGKSGSRMRAHPGYRMAYVPEADHTFSRPGNQAFVLSLLLAHLEQRPAARRAPEPPSSPSSPMLWGEPTQPAS